MKKLLGNTINGIGEVKGFVFTKIATTQHAYVYEVNSGDSNIHYEVFKRKTAPTCIDFKKRLYSETDVKEYYPKSKDFGAWAWTFKTKIESINRMEDLSC